MFVFSIVGLVYAVGFHFPYEILPGQFANGNYSFNGRLGIGTSSPTSFLHVSGVDNTWIAKFINGDNLTGYGILIDAGSSASNYAFRIRNSTGTKEIFTALGDGNVGIGTNTPGANLDVNGIVKIRTQGFQTADTVKAGTSKRLSTIFGDPWASGNPTSTTILTASDDGDYIITGFIYVRHNQAFGSIYPFVAGRYSAGVSPTKGARVGSVIQSYNSIGSTSAPTIAWVGNNLQLYLNGFNYGYAEVTSTIKSTPTIFTYASIMGG